MKKILFATLALAASTGSATYAQITIDSSNLVHVNQTVLLTTANNSSINLSDAAVAGSDIVWDFTALDSTGSYTMDFEPATTGIGSSEFPNASFAINELDASDTSSEYYLKTNAAFVDLGLTGLADGDTIALHADLPVLTFPSTFNSSYASQSSDTILVQGTGRMIMDFSIVSHIDAWGQAKMPKGTFPVIRQNIKQVLFQTIQVDNGGGNWMTVDSDRSTGYAYIWWTNDPQVKWPLLDIDYDSSGALVDDISYVNVKPQPTGILESNIRTVKIAPNPASNFIDFSLDHAGSYELTITEISGRKCLQTQFTGQSFRLDVSGLTDGIYLYHIVNKKGDSSISGKFVKR